MAETIIDNFHGLCLIVVLYYANEIVWRSRNNNFYLIENATPASSTGLFLSKWFTLNITIIFFTTLMILLGIVFQMQYNYLDIDWRAYAGVYLFTSCPLVISAGLVLIIQKLIRYKHVGLIATSAFILFTATSFGNKLLHHPLLKFQIPYKGLYSDMNGFGSYLSSFSWQYLFGLSTVTIFALLLTQLKRFKMKLVPLFSLIALIICSYMAAIKVIKDYEPKNDEAVIQAKADYEKKYRHFQNLPQPTVIEVTTTVDLFPEKNAYEVVATYIVQNKTNKPIASILVNFSDNIEITEANLISGNEVVNIKNQYTVVTLKNPLLTNDTAHFKTRFSYHWSAINGHQSFNAIVQNGSFIRISRYFPTLGYLPENEIENENDRKRFNLEKATQLPSIDAPKNSMNDFINLNMTISTSSKQTAIGVGELVRNWNKDNRSYFQYKTSSPIPFRFAVSSAEYAVKTVSYSGKNIEVYYHPAHPENVEHLLKNARLALDYCETNFGAYPFKTIRFAEVSAFTKGFAATAYPATIYMTENMIFNANIGADKKQDVINELTGHELAHLWWGNNQISPDDKEGSAMLTETLAMYTELMLVKHMYGKERVMENVTLHLGMYLNERGFTEEQPLFEVLPGNVHLSYSKSLVVMYQLTEIIGEEKVNLALRQFLQKHGYPNAKPVSTDFINELYAVTETTLHSKIDDLFKKITLYDFKIKNTSVKKTDSQYELTIHAIANKFYEDGKGRKTKASFNDSIEIAISFKNGKTKTVRLPIINNKISCKILMNEIPESLLVDPTVRFIKSGNGKHVIIANSL